MGLVELGRHTGLSPALLSKIERGRLFPTLPTLLRVALVFSVDLQYFLSGAREKPVMAIVRQKERLKFPEKPDAHESTYLHEHPGAELIYALRGTLVVQIAGEEHMLRAGDSTFFLRFDATRRWCEGCRSSPRE